MHLGHALRCAIPPHTAPVDSDLVCSHPACHGKPAALGVGHSVAVGVVPRLHDSPRRCHAATLPTTSVIV